MALALFVDLFKRIIASSWLITRSKRFAGGSPDETRSDGAHCRKIGPPLDVMEANYGAVCFAPTSVLKNCRQDKGLREIKRLAMILKLIAKCVVARAICATG